MNGAPEPLAGKKDGTLPGDPPAPATDIPALTALRGLAVLIVFVSHAANDGLLPRWLGAGFGQMGVQLFFLLSGFLMVHLYAARPATGPEINRFLVARAARILPLYWGVLFLSLALAGLAPGFRYQFQSGEFLPALLLVEAPFELWSIPVEAQFYGLFIALWLILPAWRRDPIGFWVLTLAVALPAAFLWRGFVSEAKTLIPYAFAFLLGGAIAEAYRSYWRRLLPWLSAPWLHAAALALLVLNIPGLRAALGLELTEGFYPRTWLDPLRLTALALFFTLTLVPNGIGRMGGIGWLSRLGTISFGFYLFHRPVLRAAETIFWQSPGAFTALVGFGFTALLAWVSFHFYERPAARVLRARLGARRHRSPPPEAGKSRAGGKTTSPEATGAATAAPQASPNT